jgi:hypothetical protein
MVRGILGCGAGAVHTFLEGLLERGSPKGGRGLLH